MIVKKYYSTLFLFALFFYISDIQGQEKKVIFAIVDGIPTDVIEKVATPNLDKITDKGGFANIYVGGEKGTYSQTPTISAVGYNSLLTGTWVNKHNVWGNGIKDPNYNYPTIFRFFKDQYPDKKTAIYSTWEDNRTKLIGEDLPETDHIKLDYHFDGLELDTVNYPHDDKSDYIHKIDEAVVQKAEEHLKTEAPDLSWVYLQYTDDMGHIYGDSEEMYNAVRIMDDQIGKLWAVLNYREDKFGEDWTIYITTDHGRDAMTGKGHGGQSERERATWLVTNQNQLNNYFRSGSSAIIDIMPSIANDLDIDIPEENAKEIDGIPLNSELSLSQPKMELVDDKLVVKWKPWSTEGEVKVYLSTTNKFKEGKSDDYKMIKTVPVDQGATVLDVENYDTDFYKVYLKGEKNGVNIWHQ